MTKTELNTLQSVYDFLEQCESIEQARYEIERYVAHNIIKDVAKREVDIIADAIFYPECAIIKNYMKDFGATDAQAEAVAEHHKEVRNPFYFAGNE